MSGKRSRQDRSAWLTHWVTWLMGMGLLMLAACSSPPKAVAIAPPLVQNLEPAAVERLRSEIALHALTLLDQPYARGGRGPASGFDCSGLVSHVYQQAGLKVGGSAAQMAGQARQIAREALQPGDLVFFNTEGAPFSHVGVYVGSGRFVHASNPRTGVRIDPLERRYYAERFDGAYRLLP